MLYSYRCPNCGEEIELSRLIAQRDVPVPCVACASGRYVILMQRVIINSVAVIVQGGRYVGSPSKWVERAEDMQQADTSPANP